MSQIGAKKTLEEAWPIRNKRFFVAVDHGALIAGAAAAKAAAQPSEDSPSVRPAISVVNSLPTIQRIVSGKGKVVVASTFGDFTGNSVKMSGDQRSKAVAAFATDPSSTRGLVALLKANISDAADVTFCEDPLCAADLVNQLLPGGILVLENLRFYKNEFSDRADDRLSFASVLATYADVFVNDCFSNAHLTLASTVELPRLLRHGATGSLVERELLYFSRVLTHPARPTCMVVAGGHVAEKLVLIRGMLGGKVDRILIGGSVSFPFLVAKGFSAGSGYSPSVVQLRWSEDGPLLNSDVYAARLLTEAVSARVRIFLPVDFATHTTAENTKTPVLTQGPNVPRDVFALDVGPQTVSLFVKEVRECRTVFWGGCLGAVGFGERWAESSLEFARGLSQANVLSVVCGGSTAALVRKAGAAMNISHVSSGEASAFELLLGNVLPAMAALTDATTAAASTGSSAVDLLRHLPLFAGCTAQQLQQLARKAVRRSHSVGDFLIYDGDHFSGMWVVASGRLVACPRSAYGKALAVRTVGVGHVVGQWECVARRASTETVVVAAVDTSTYQLTTAAILETIGEVPDLARQLLANCTDLLHVVSTREHHREASEERALAMDLTAMRKPLPLLGPVAPSLARNVLVNMAAVAATHFLVRQYAPFNKIEGTCAFAVPQDGLFARMAVSAIRDISYSNLQCANTGKSDHCSLSGTLFAAVASAAIASPVVAAAEGAPFHKMTVDSLVQGAVTQGALALAPAFAHGAFLYSKTSIELSSRCRGACFSGLSATSQVMLAAICRAVVSLAAFPLAVRSANRNAHTIMVFVVKQIVSLFVELSLHRALMMS